MTGSEPFLLRVADIEGDLAASAVRVLNIKAAEGVFGSFYALFLLCVFSHRCNDRGSRMKFYSNELLENEKIRRFLSESQDREQIEDEKPTNR
jgi:hypothetical protein